MAVIKSYSVGNGDMFCIRHNSNNLTIIDCCLNDDVAEHIIGDLTEMCSGEEMHRLISTHPDEDHIRGLKRLNDSVGIWNFCCVENQAIKKNPSDNFDYYCQLRDGLTTVMVHDVFKGTSYKWLNESGVASDGKTDYGCAGINFLWPEKDNPDFKSALLESAKGNGFNNISPIIVYRLEKGVVAMWMGDMETDFLNKIKDYIKWEKIDVLFAPHHGRNSAKVPEDVLRVLDPRVVIIGEARSDELNYYKGYNRILQNSAKDITLNCRVGWVDVYSSSKTYKPKDDFLAILPGHQENSDDNYIGSFQVGQALNQKHGTNYLSISH